MNIIQKIWSVNGRNIFICIFFFGLFVSPFIYWPWAPIPYEIPRVSFILRWIEILSVVGLIGIVTFRISLGKSDALLMKLVLLFFTLTILSSLFGVDMWKSIWGNYYRRDGIYTYKHLISLSLLLSMTWQKRWFMPFAGFLSVSSCVLSVWTTLYGILLYVFHNEFIPNWAGAIGISFGQPKFLTGYLLVTLPCTLYLFHAVSSRFWKFIVFGMIMCAFVAIGFTKSWAGYGGIFLFLFLWFVFSRPKFSIITYLIPLCSFIFIAGYWLYIQYYNPLPHRILAETRHRIWIKAFLALKEKPVLGWGWANFDYAFTAIDWPYHFNVDAHVDKAHSVLIEILVTTGIVGFIAYGVFLLRLMYILSFGKTKEMKILFFIVLMYLFHSQTNVLSIAEELLFWIIVGIVARSAGEKVSI